jgi:hypothetical protein
MKKKTIMGLIGLSLLSEASDFYYENGKKIDVVKIEKVNTQEKRSSGMEIEYYKTSKGNEVGVKNDILVECKKDENCQEVLSAYETLSVEALSDTIFIVTIAKDKNIFEFSQKLYRDVKIKIAHPNFRKNKRRR